MAMLCEEALTLPAFQQKLSTLMRLGASLSPEYRDAYAGIVIKGSDISTLTIGTNPLGSAYEAITGLLPHTQMGKEEEEELYQALFQATGTNLSRERLVLYQVGSGGQLFPENNPGDMQLDHCIDFLSRSLRLTREQIADVLEHAGY